VAGVEDSAHRL